MICGGTGVLDACNVCDGPGINWDEGECDCLLNKVDKCGKCGGTGIPDGFKDCDGTPNEPKVVPKVEPKKPEP